MSEARKRCKVNRSVPLQRCTLVGGVKKGQAFDAMKMTSLKVSTVFRALVTDSDTSPFQALEDFGIRSSRRSGHLSENATKNIKRKCKNKYFNHNSNHLKLHFDKLLLITTNLRGRI